MPRFLECLRAILSEEGAVNLECKVIGVPQPVLRWYKDGEELKLGDIHRIISGQDSTCCLGTYTCEVRNCLGTVASSASLLGFEGGCAGAGGGGGGAAAGRGGGAAGRLPGSGGRAPPTGVAARPGAHAPGGAGGGNRTVGGAGTLARAQGNVVKCLRPNET